MTFGQKLQCLRKANGLSQEQLAAQITVSRQAVSKWELNSAMPDTDNILQISKLFGVSTDYLLDNNIEAQTVITDKKTVNINQESEAPQAEVLEKPPSNKKKTIRICLVVLAIYMVAFAVAIITVPIFLPFFAIAATAVSIAAVTAMTWKR